LIRFQGHGETYPEFLLFGFQIGHVLLLFLHSPFIPREFPCVESVENRIDQPTRSEMAPDNPAAYLFSLHLWMNSSFTFLNIVTVCRVNSLSEAIFL
jgi:hypothetical protein